MSSSPQHEVWVWKPSLPKVQGTAHKNVSDMVMEMFEKALYWQSVIETCDENRPKAIRCAYEHREAHNIVVLVFFRPQDASRAIKEMDGERCLLIV
jgi:hypothetical protein